MRALPQDLLNFWPQSIDEVFLWLQLPRALMPLCQFGVVVDALYRLSFLQLGELCHLS